MGLQHRGTLLRTTRGGDSFGVGVLVTVATRQAGARAFSHGCLPQVYVVAGRGTSEGGFSLCCGVRGEATPRYADPTNDTTRTPRPFTVGGQGWPHSHTAFRQFLFHLGYSA